MALSLSDIIIILIGAVAIIAIIGVVFLVVYAHRRRSVKKFVSLPTEDAFEDEKVDFESGRRAQSAEWQRHHRTLSDSSDTPLMARTNPHQWTPSPSRSSFGAEVHNAAPYRDVSPEKRSPPSRLQELPLVAKAGIGSPSRRSPHKKTSSASFQRTPAGLQARPAIIPPPLPTSTQPLKIHKGRRTGSMRTTLLTKLASTRQPPRQATVDDDDVSPKSIYSQSSFAYSLRQASRPGSIYDAPTPPVPEIPTEFRQPVSQVSRPISVYNEPAPLVPEIPAEFRQPVSQNVDAARSTSSVIHPLPETRSSLRDSVVFQFPPVSPSEPPPSFEELSLSPADALPKTATADVSSPVTLYAETEASAESPAEEGQWRSLRSKLLNTIQDHESVSRFPSLKY